MLPIAAQCSLSPSCIELACGIAVARTDGREEGGGGVVELAQCESPAVVVVLVVQLLYRLHRMLIVALQVAGSAGFFKSSMLRPMLTGECCARPPLAWTTLEMHSLAVPSQWRSCGDSRVRISLLAFPQAEATGRMQALEGSHGRK